MQFYDGKTQFYGLQIYGLYGPRMTWVSKSWANFHFGRTILLK